MYKLRELERKDIEIINSWRNDRALIANLGAPFRFINADIDTAWYDNYLSSRNNTIRCSVVDEKDEIIALVSLTNIDRLNQTAVIHIMVGSEENCGKGIGTFAMSNMIKHAFYDMNLRRIELSVLEENIRAQRLYKKIGFQVEGMRREAVYKDGMYKNMYLMSLLKSEYKGI